MGAAYLPSTPFFVGSGESGDRFPVSKPTLGKGQFEMAPRRSALPGLLHGHTHDLSIFRFVLVILQPTLALIAPLLMAFGECPRRPRLRREER